MRPLLLNTHQDRGGAAIAALRLHRGLRAIGVDSTLRVQLKRSDEPGVRGPRGPAARALAWLRPRLDGLPARLHARRRGDLFSAAWVPDDLARAVGRLAPDLVPLHWIAHGFARVESLARLGRPLVWTLHDSWAFTGGCHLPFDCTRYAAWRGLDLTLVAPSRWLAGCVASSALLGGARREVIPNGLDLERFRPGDRAAARARLGIGAGRDVVLCGGAGIGRDLHKGLALLAAALRSLPAERRATLELLVFGTEPGDALPDAGVAVRDLGYIRDEAALAALFAVADVFVTPSLHENLPNTVMEAMACGIPCVAFDLGGLPDLIGHEREGWLARPGQADDLARGIAWVLADPARRAALGARARARAEAEFEIGQVARRHAALYRDVLERARAGSG